MAKNDALFADMNLREGTPGGKKGLTLTSRLIVIPLDEMDSLARESIAVSLCVSRASKTKVSEEIERISRLHAGIQSFDDGFVHLSRVRKWALTEANDIEMSKMKSAVNQVSAIFTIMQKDADTAHVCYRMRRLAAADAYP